MKNLVDKAKASHPKSLVGASSPTTPVFSYTAPQESGSGTIQIFLHGDKAEWAPADGDAELSAYGKPDAIVAPNAGLGSYPSWHPVIVWTHATSTPFGVTEYSEQSCEIQEQVVQAVVQRQAMAPGSVVPPGPGVPTGVEAMRSMMKPREFKIALNPFQGPGQRPVPTKVPNVPNGFTIRIVGKELSSLESRNQQGKIEQVDSDSDQPELNEVASSQMSVEAAQSSVSSVESNMKLERGVVGLPLFSYFLVPIFVLVLAWLYSRS